MRKILLYASIGVIGLAIARLLRQRRRPILNPPSLTFLFENPLVEAFAGSRACYELAQEWLTNAENWGPTENQTNRGIRIPMRFFSRVHNTVNTLYVVAGDAWDRPGSPYHRSEDALRATCRLVLGAVLQPPETGA